MGIKGIGWGSLGVRMEGLRSVSMIFSVIFLNLRARQETALGLENLLLPFV